MATTITLDRQELASVLAGLRLVQAELARGEYLPQGVHDIYDDGGTIEGLSDDQLDELCERINWNDEPQAAVSQDEAAGARAIMEAENTNMLGVTIAAMCERLDKLEHLVACNRCHGKGIISWRGETDECHDCHGTKINPILTADA